MATFRKVIAMVDGKKPNSFTEEQKFQWLAELDGIIAADIFLIDIGDIRQLAYTYPKDMDRDLLVGYPHEGVYEAWLSAMIDQENGEYEKYQNTMQIYNQRLSRFARWFGRTYEPAQGQWVQRSDVPTYYLTAYGLAKNMGFTGTLEDWLVSLIGPKGDAGRSVRNAEIDSDGELMIEFDDGVKTYPGGVTAYALAREQGFAGTLAEWLASLVGPKGESGYSPRAGIDYFTDADREAMTQTLAALLQAMPLALRKVLCTRDVYVGGARDVYGVWGPRNPLLVDHTPVDSSVKNAAYISTMQIPRDGQYFLIAPTGSNYLFKLEIVEDGRTRELDMNALPAIAAGTYGDGTRYLLENDIAIIFSAKTRVDDLTATDSGAKVFDDGFVGSKRLNFQKTTAYANDDPSMPYPAVEFTVEGPAEVRAWWVAGGDGRCIAIASKTGSGPSRMEVSGTFAAHGSAEVADTMKAGHLKVENEAKIGGSLEVEKDIKMKGSLDVGNDVRISGHVSFTGGDGMDLGGNDIENVQSMRMSGTLEVKNDSRLRSIKPQKKIDEEGLEQERYNIGTDESYYDKGCFNKVRVGTPIRDSAGRIIGHEYSELDREKLKALLSYGSAQADLNAKEGEPGHVLNRTHWKEVKAGGVILDSTIVSFQNEYGSIDVGSEGITDGEKYTVTWNGTEYTCTAFMYNGGLTLGNASLYGSGGEDTGEPFVFEVFLGDSSSLMKNSATAEDVTVKIEVPSEVTIHKLPGEFLPDGVPYSEDSGSVIILPECKHVFDADGFIEIKNSPLLEAGKTYIVNWNGVEYTCVGLDGTALGETGTVVLGDVYAASGGNVGSASTGEPFILVAGNRDDGNGNAIPFMVIASLDGTTDLTLSIYEGCEIVHKLDNKFLDLDWLPTRGKPQTLFNNPKLAFNYINELFNGGRYSGSNISLGALFELVAGKSYTVKWNGVEYKCVAKFEYNVCYLGNLSLSVRDAVDTGEPFIISLVDGIEDFDDGPVTGFYAEATQEEYEAQSEIYRSVIISEAEGEPSKLPEGFLPDSVVTRTEFEAALGAYITDVATLVGGDA